MPPAAESVPVRVPLRTLLGDYPATRALRQGALTSSLAPLDFADVAVPNKAFKRVVRDLEFDVAELALMTFLMARSRDVPLRSAAGGGLQPQSAAASRLRQRAPPDPTHRLGRLPHRRPRLHHDNRRLDPCPDGRPVRGRLRRRRVGHARGRARGGRGGSANRPSCLNRRGLDDDAARRRHRCRYRRSSSRRSAIRFGGARSGRDVPRVAAPAWRANPQPRDRGPRVARHGTARLCASCSGCSATAGRSWALRWIAHRRRLAWPTIAAIWRWRSRSPTRRACWRAR